MGFAYREQARRIADVDATENNVVDARHTVFAGEQPVLAASTSGGETLRLRRPESRLSPVDTGLADVGFFTAPEARGRGYGPAALAAVCRWGFTALRLARIEWRANVGNTASRRMAEKAGFVFEGTARSALNHRGRRVDAWVGALLATDPAPRPAQAAREMTP
ncbi:MAG TPA: GNAT family protein [Micromonospora sp.]|nr:GNAT family protein [Micromonospora sp.]